MGKRNPLDKRMELLGKNLKKGNLYSAPKEPKEKKEKERKMSQKEMYYVTLSTFQFHLYEVICMINGIDPDVYLDDSGQGLYRNMKFNDTFRNLSHLEWDTPAPIDGLRFRGRFLTALLLKVIRKSHDCVVTACRTITKERKYKMMNDMLCKWMTYVESFIITYLSSNGDYQKWLLAIEGFLMIDTEVDVPKFMTALIETGDTILSKEEPGICVANTTRIAYILATHGAKTKKCPKYNEEYDYRDDMDIANQIGQLGYAILKYRREKNKKLPILYSAFQKANPQVVSRFYGMNEDKPELTVGLRALEFTKIFFNQETRNNNLVGRMM